MAEIRDANKRLTNKIEEMQKQLENQPAQEDNRGLLINTEISNGNNNEASERLVSQSN